MAMKNMQAEITHLAGPLPLLKHLSRKWRMRILCNEGQPSSTLYDSSSSMSSIDALIPATKASG